MRNFNQFLNRINETNDPLIFKGLKGDPFQYKIEGDKTYYAKKYLGTLASDSNLWIEQTKEIGIKAIKDLYSKVSSDKGVDPVDEDTKSKIIQFQESLNKAKPIIPKFWVLPLKADGNFGWKTFYAFWEIMYAYNNTYDLDDVRNWSKYNFDIFKSDEFWSYPISDKPGLSPLERFTEFMETDSTESYYEGGKLNWDKIIDWVNSRIDPMLGNLPKEGYVDFLYCTKYVKSIPDGIKAGTIDIYPDSPISSIPKSITCGSLNVSSKKKIIIPKIDTNSITINGPSVLSPEWTQIDYLYLQENASIGYITPTIDSIPSTLKEIGSLSLSAESITKIPDGLTIGIIKSSYEKDPDPVIYEEPVITSGGESHNEDPSIVSKKRTPWWKRIFRRKSKNESIDTQLYEKYKITGDLSIVNCFNIKTLPKDLTVLGDFYIDGSGIQNNFTDEQIREVCTIKGRILRFGGEEGVLQIP